MDDVARHSSASAGALQEMRTGMPAEAFGKHGSKNYFTIIAWDRHNLFAANARPEPDLRYFSKSTALSLSVNAKNITSFHGTYFAVCSVVPQL
jgi:hypothetical protein